MPDDYATRGDLAALEQRRMVVEEQLRQDIRTSEEKLEQRAIDRDRQLRRDVKGDIDEAIGRTHERIDGLATHLDERLDQQDESLGRIEKAREIIAGRLWTFIILAVSGALATLVALGILAILHHW